MPQQSHAHEKLSHIIARLQPEIARRSRELHLQREGNHEHATAQLDAETRLRIEEIVNAKVDAAGARLNRYTGGIVATSIIPPLVGAPADLALIIAMQKDIASIFAIDIEDDALFMTTGLRALVASLRSLVTEAGISALIRMTARRAVYRQFTKFIPGVGLVVSASIGIGLVRRIGKKSIEQHRDAATQILTSALLSAS